jgi:RNA polymerase sigma-70 factor (ECF subfamily)
MSSEAAAYFPNGLAEASDTGVGANDRGHSHAVSARGSSASEATGSTISETSDDQLLSQVGLGSSDALATLYRRIAPSVYRVAVRILKDEAEAEDLVHDVFIFLFDKASQFDPTKGSARSWIIHATYHRAFNRRNFLRVRHHYQTIALDNDATYASAEPSLNGIAAQQLAGYFQAVLKPNQRRVLELHFFGGQSFREIAEQTGQTLENTRKLYLRGTQRLRAYVFRQKETTK